jgi:hypothetical protein
MDWMVFLMENPMNNGWFIGFFSWKILDGMKHFVWIIPTKPIGNGFYDCSESPRDDEMGREILLVKPMGISQTCREDDERVIPEPNVVLGLQLSWVAVRSKYSSK